MKVYRYEIEEKESVNIGDNMKFLKIFNLLKIIFFLVVLKQKKKHYKGKWNSDWSIRCRDFNGKTRHTDFYTFLFELYAEAKKNKPIEQKNQLT